MKVPQYLYENFEKNFETSLFHFLESEKLLSKNNFTDRFLNRTVVPHIQNLSQEFNRKKGRKTIDASYWKNSSNPKNLQLAYFLYFMPFNFFRTGSIVGELDLLGFDWNLLSSKKNLEVIEFGSGPASGLTGFLNAIHGISPTLFDSFEGALIDQNKAVGELGERWLNSFAEQNSIPLTQSRFFHRKLDLTHQLLPPKSPSFDVWIMSYFLNEHTDSLTGFTPIFLKAIEKHLNENGLVLIIEPALKEESRKLLAWRKNLIESMKDSQLQILLPCLGKQNCGALEKQSDWCHEDILFLRPKYIEALDRACELNHRSLPFSYLVLMKTKKPLHEVFKRIKTSSTSQELHRVVSPSHKNGKELEFFLCGTQGKFKTRFRPTRLSADQKTEIRQSGGKVENEVNRGDIIETQIVSEAEAAIKKIETLTQLKKVNS